MDVDQASSIIAKALKNRARLLGTTFTHPKGLFGIPRNVVNIPGVGSFDMMPLEFERYKRQIKNAQKNAGKVQPWMTPEQKAIIQLVNQYERLEGMALDSGHYRTLISYTRPLYLTSASITADELDIIEDAGNKALGAIGKVPSSYDDTAVEDWAKAVAYGAAAMACIKNQLTMLRLQPKLTRSDASTSVPWTRTSLKLHIDSLCDLRIPPLCYPLAELFTRVLQTGGAEHMSGIEAQYFMPFIHGIAEADFITELNSIEALDKSGLFANYIGKPLVNPSKSWLNKPHILPFYSDYGQWIAETLPCESNDGGVAQHAEAWDGDVSVYFNQALGMPELYDASALMREAAAGTSALFLDIADPAADKLSFGYASSKSVTSFPAFPDSSVKLDCLYQVSEARSATMRGIFGHDEFFMQYHTINGDEDGWDRKLTGWLFNRIFSPKIPVVSLSRLLPSIDRGLDKMGVPVGTANQTNYGRRAA